MIWQHSQINLIAKTTLNQMKNNKVTIIDSKFPQKLSENSKEKCGINSILVTDSVTEPKQGCKKQVVMISKKFVQNNFAKTVK